VAVAKVRGRQYETDRRVWQQLRYVADSMRLRLNASLYSYKAHAD